MTSLALTLQLSLCVCTCVCVCVFVCVCACGSVCERTRRQHRRTSCSRTQFHTNLHSTVAPYNHVAHLQSRQRWQMHCTCIPHAYPFSSLSSSLSFSSFFFSSASFSSSSPCSSTALFTSSSVEVGRRRDVGGRGQSRGCCWK